MSATARLLRDGNLVAFPTETVYGLGGDAMNAKAVRRVFDLKGRPSTNPLIVHVADVEPAQRFASDWPDAAEALAARFWPGPLTVVLPKRSDVPPEVTAGLDTVALRAPDHLTALELLREFDGGLVGPSANRSGHISPTTAEHVRDEFGDEVAILDGGPCRVGIESTVIDLTTTPPAILRPGAIALNRLRDILGDVATGSLAVPTTQAAKSPGQFERHYAPLAPTFRYEPGVDVPADAVVLRFGKDLPDDPDRCGRELYRILRDAERTSPRSIWIELPPDTPDWSAVRDRLLRATAPDR